MPALIFKLFNNKASLLIISQNENIFFIEFLPVFGNYFIEFCIYFEKGQNGIDGQLNFFNFKIINYSMPYYLRKSLPFCFQVLEGK